MFGIKKLKSDNKSLSEQVEILQQKSFTPQIFWDSNGNTIPLFDFDNQNEIKKAVSSVPELASAINFISKSFSNGKYHIYSKDKLIEKHKLYNLFKNPHPLFNGSEFQKTVAENLYSYGIAYIFVNKPGVEIKGMFVIPSYSVKVYVGSLSHKQLREATNIKDVIKYYEININGKKIEIEPDNIIPIQLNTNISVKDKYLIFESPLKPLEKALQVTPAMYDSMQNLMNNGGMKGFVSNKSKNEYGSIEINPEEKKELQKAFKNYGSKSNQHDIAFTNSELNYIPITSRIKDMLLPDQQKMIEKIIFSILGVDSSLINGDEKKYDNYNISRKSFYTETIIPAANNYAEALTNYIQKELIKLDYTYLDVFSEDEKIKSEKISVESIYIINLNKSVSLKEMSRESAIEFLIINGYDEETAKKLIQ